GVFIRAEGGIRGALVTGVQTCALPSSGPRGVAARASSPRGVLPLARARPGLKGARRRARHRQGLRERLLGRRDRLATGAAAARAIGGASCRGSEEKWEAATERRRC